MRVIQIASLVLLATSVLYTGLVAETRSQRWMGVVSVFLSLLNAWVAIAVIPGRL